MPKTRRIKRRKAPKRTVYCQDALGWLQSHTTSPFPALVTSLPDAAEVNLKGPAYEAFFRTAAALCLAAVKDNGYCVFLQTDRKQKGWMSKAYWILDEATKAGQRLLWHKIALRTDVGKTDLFRPTYSHMLCFSRTGSIGIPSPNVIHRGAVTYKNAFGQDAVTFVLQYLHKRGIREVVDPFVGSGTTLAIANRLGMNAVGVDIDPAQCKKAREATI